ncbi:MAG: J domain-containing protein [Myxococcota bacterium]
MSDLWKRATRILRAKLAARAQVPPEAGFSRGGFDAGPGADFDARGGADAGRAADGERAQALALLELAPGASATQVRSAYRRLCRKYHPDRFAHDDAKASAAHELFVEIHRAYELLMEPGRA